MNGPTLVAVFTVTACPFTYTAKSVVAAPLASVKFVRYFPSAANAPFEELTVHVLPPPYVAVHRTAEVTAALPLTMASFSTIRRYVTPLAETAAGLHAVPIPRNMELVVALAFAASANSPAKSGWYSLNLDAVTATPQLAPVFPDHSFDASSVMVLFCSSYAGSVAVIVDAEVLTPPVAIVLLMPVSVEGYFTTIATASDAPALTFTRAVTEFGDPEFKEVAANVEPPAPPIRKNTFPVVAADPSEPV